MPEAIANEDAVLNYDPESPQERIRSAGMAAVSKSSNGACPTRQFPVPAHPDAQRVSPREFRFP